MSQPLPLSGFKFLSNDQLESFDYKNISVEGNVGYILEIDLEYPSDRHDSQRIHTGSEEYKSPKCTYKRTEY